ncbi:hypothetical protein B7P33_02410 [Sediminicola luteus]|uniref:Uncharacterized protein n=2 Tax=Sediminicola luteus TaxID=319238 RepID=A0A2A4GB34_9FLAO|nr:hypothetical protein B7P33_02410 [Sediminicola luteus]
MFHILLANLVLLQALGVGARDIIQFNELVEHARFHQQTYGDDFLTFLSKHYGEQKEDHEKNHQEEKEQHGALPFQKATHVAELALTAPFLEMERPRLVLMEQRTKIFSYENLHSLFEPRGIFQPPKA